MRRHTRLPGLASSGLVGLVGASGCSATAYACLPLSSKLCGENTNLDRLVAEASMCQPCVPASTMKVLTAATALITLSPSFRFETTIVLEKSMPGRPLRVTLVGAGDASLTSEGLHAAVSRAKHGLRNALKEQEANVVEVGTDDGAFRDGGKGKPCDEWMAEDLDAGYGVEPSAVVVDGNVAVIEVVSDSGGVAPLVRCKCASCTGKPAKRRIDVHGLRVHVVLANDAANNNQHKVCSLRFSRARGTYEVRGVPSSPVRFVVPVLDAKAWVAHRLAHLLSEVMADDGTEVVVLDANDDEGGGGGGGVVDVSNSTKVLAVHTSEPLLDFLTRMLHESRNLDAECLLHVIGAAKTLKRDHLESTAQLGLRALRSLLSDAAGVEVASRCHISDASGLSRKNLMTPCALNALLRHIAFTSTLQPLIACMPSPGDVGATTHSRLPDLKGVLRVKTGSMNGISALCGYVMDEKSGGMPLACFACISVGGTARLCVDEVARAVYNATTAAVVVGELPKTIRRHGRWRRNVVVTLVFLVTAFRSSRRKSVVVAR